MILKINSHAILYADHLHNYIVNCYIVSEIVYSDCTIDGFKKSFREYNRGLILEELTPKQKSIAYCNIMFDDADIVDYLNLLKRYLSSLAETNRLFMEIVNYESD